MPLNPTLLLSIAVPLVLVVALFVRTGREQPLRFDQLWITPAVAVLSIGATLALQPHDGFGPVAWGVVVIGAGIGVTTGTLRARTVRMRIDPDTGVLLSQTSSYAFILFAALLGFRLLAAPPAGIGPPRPEAMIGFDAALAFALAMIVAQRIGIFRRASRLRSGARR